MSESIATKNSAEIEQAIKDFRDSFKTKKAASEMDPALLIEQYILFSSQNKVFRVGECQTKDFSLSTRKGAASANTESKRNEEQFCQALFNSSTHPVEKYVIPDFEQTIVDYQTPTKHVRADTGWGKIDLMGLISGEAGTQLCFWEVKAKGNSDTIPFAIAELMVYFAQFDDQRNPQAKSNYEQLYQEVLSVRADRLGAINPNKLITESLPVLFIAAEPGYFQAHKFEANRSLYLELQNQLKAKLDVNLQFVEIHGEAVYNEADKCFEMKDLPAFRII